MPWQLTTPLAVGDLDVAAYDQIRIVQLMHDSVREVLHLTISYGRTVAGKWAAGSMPAGKEFAFSIEGTDYTDLITHVSKDGELTYNSVKRGLFEWLLAEGHIAAGSIV
jgi:hypothetical protein